MPLGLWGQSNTLRIAFTGDILLDRGVRTVIEKKGIDYLFDPMLDSVFASCNIVIGNLECPATKIEAPVNKRFIFRGEPEWLHALKFHGFTHLNMANNHTMDQGREGLLDTWRNIQKAQMIPLGAGSTADEAEQPFLLAIHPRPIYIYTSLFAYSENWLYLREKPNVNQLKTSSLATQIIQCRRQHPDAYIIVLLHWGLEHSLKPTLSQTITAEQLLKSGADCIVGHHSHTVQDYGELFEKPVYYNIGNYIFDQSKPINSQALVIRLDITSRNAIHYALPIQIKNCRPSLKKI